MNNRNAPGQVGLVLFIVLAILPIVFSIMYALSYSTGLTGLLSEGFTLSHWKTVAYGNEIWLSFILSIYISLCTVIITISCSLTIALLFRTNLSAGPLSYIIYLPLAIPANGLWLSCISVPLGGWPGITHTQFNRNNIRYK